MESNSKNALHITSIVLVLTAVSFEISRLFGSQEKDAFLRAVGHVSAVPLSSLSLWTDPLLPQVNTNVCIFPAKLSLSCSLRPASKKHCTALL